MLAFASWNPSSSAEERHLQVQALYLSALRSGLQGFGSAKIPMIES